MYVKNQILSTFFNLNNNMRSNLSEFDSNYTEKNNN